MQNLQVNNVQQIEQGEFLKIVNFQMLIVVVLAYILDQKGVMSNTTSSDDIAGINSICNSLSKI